MMAISFDTGPEAPATAEKVAVATPETLRSQSISVEDADARSRESIAD